LFTGTVLSVDANETNPDWISIVVQYDNGEDKQFTRQYDWISSTVTPDNFDQTIQDELTKMNIDTPATVELLQDKIGNQYSVEKDTDGKASHVIRKPDRPVINDVKV
jgi:hypothetical protein